MDDASESSHSSPEAVSAQSQAKKRAERPCDTCRKRKSRCVKEAEQERCVLCTFHNRECTFNDVPPPRRKRTGPIDDSCASIEDGGDNETRRARKKTKGTQTDENSTLLGGPILPGTRSLLDRTLGLHRTTHFKYIGPSSLHEERLLDLIHRFYESGNGEDGCKFRRVADSTTFLSKSDRHTLFSADVDSDLEAIEQLVQPHGPALVDLYFRIVHPSYPVLHKGVFLEKYKRTYKEFSPPLLAAVYLLAMDWWEYDRGLASRPNPDGEALLRIAMKALTGVVHRPKLSSVQAGLLLLQRAGGDSWVLTTQVVGIGEELGLHLDCKSWNIPDWEKGLRRRLGWAIVMQDKWGALIHGRPSHVMMSVWKMPELDVADFPESAADEDDKEGSTEVEKGRQLFIWLVRLTQILSEALDTLYSPDQTAIQEVVATSGVEGILELIKPLAVNLKSWANKLPAVLRMDDVKTRKLCSNGYLHLAYFVSEIIIYRHVIRSLGPFTSAEMRTVTRDAAKTRLERAINFVEDLRPEHLQAFWWFAAPKSLAFIRTYGGLLWATSATDEEADFYRRKLEDFRWSLKVRAKGVSFVAAALQEMDESLQDIDMTQSPIGRNPESREAATSLCTMIAGANDAETQTPAAQEAALHMLQSRYFSPETSPVYSSMLDVDVEAHEYMPDGTDQGFSAFYAGLTDP